MATFAPSGKYGQVEANRLTGLTFGNIEAQAPAVTRGLKSDGKGGTIATQTAIDVLENGMFLCVVQGDSESSRIAVVPGDAVNSVPYLVYSEKKMYDERMGYSDFAMKAAESVDGMIYPRLIGITPDSCVFTTNTIDEAAESLEEGDVLYIGDDGYLSKTPGDNEHYQFLVTKVYTLPDGSEAVKLMAQKFVATAVVSGP